MGCDESPCSLDVALAVVGGKWKPLILYHLNSGPKRFGDLRRLVAGISEKVLIQQLREGSVKNGASCPGRGGHVPARGRTGNRSGLMCSLALKQRRHASSLWPDAGSKPN